MGVLDQVTKMKKQGIAEEEIVNNLTQQGISPREINDALRQSQIKNAVSSTSDMGDEMQSSMMPDAEAPVPEDQEQDYQPQEEQQYQPSNYEEQAPAQQEYQPQEQQYTQGGENYSPSAGGVDTDTIIEIADQLFSEKIKKFQKQIDASTEGNALLQTKLENLSERLKKIEMIIDKLQIAILEKVGSYGQNLESVKKEMSMMQDSFSKMVSPQREMKRQVSQEEMNPSQREIRKQPQQEYQQPQQEKEFSPEEFKTSPKKVPTRK